MSNPTLNPPINQNPYFKPPVSAVPIDVHPNSISSRQQRMAFYKNQEIQNVAEFYGMYWYIYWCVLAFYAWLVIFVETKKSFVKLILFILFPFVVLTLSEVVLTIWTKYLVMITNGSANPYYKWYIT